MYVPKVNGWKFESSPKKYCFLTILRFYE